jgi:NAD+ synthase
METQTALKLANDISAWLRDYVTQAGLKTLVVGISGGIDSAVVSTLCARSGVDTCVLSMPIRQRSDQDHLSREHGRWLVANHPDRVTHRVIDLSETFTQFERATGQFGYKNLLGLANSRSRLRMACLYQAAQSLEGLVVGTGNRVEDFGVGFFTKYGDGGVDISPIGDLTKSEVWSMGRALGIHKDIIDAAPTDGLWDDGRTDQDQLGGLAYPELERAMDLHSSGVPEHTLNDEDQILVQQYQRIRGPNLHKMVPIPVFNRGDRHV